MYTRTVPRNWLKGKARVRTHEMTMYIVFVRKYLKGRNKTKSHLHFYKIFKNVGR